VLSVVLKRVMIFKHKIILLLCVVIWLICPRAFAEEGTPGNFKNPIAVQEILTGKRTAANVAWWGFDKNDSTSALQSAINSGAEKVIVPYMGSDWIVHPIKLASNQEIYFEPGVVVVAKKGEFKSTSDSLFKAVNKSNITLRGYGASLRMQKRDYMGLGYKEGQWRMALLFAGCSNMKVLGLTLRDSGGDGVYLGAGKDKKQACKDILIKDCIFDNNYRQGISVISVENLRVDNCVFKNTSGHKPGAGIDLEPNHDHNRLVNIVISNCISLDNEGPGFVLGLHHLNAESSDISILFYNCYVVGCKWGVQVLSNSDVGPKGLIEFRNCTSEDTSGSGVWVMTRTNSFDLRFSNCKIKNAGSAPAKVSSDERYNVPVFLRIKRQKAPEKVGNIEFSECYVYDQKDRPAIRIWPYEQSSGELNVKGNIHVQNRYAGKLSSGLDTKDIVLKVNRLPR